MKYVRLVAIMYVHVLNYRRPNDDKNQEEN